jgi:hypothetical protein
MRLARFLVGLSAPLFALGCDGVDNIGRGSETLEVRAVVVEDGNETIVFVEVEKDGAAVVGIPTIQVAAGEDGAPVGMQDLGNGDYVTILGPYVGFYSLEIIRGEDDLTADLEGPAPVVILDPPQGFIFDATAGEDLEVSWEADGNVTQTQVSVGGFRFVEDGDPGEVTIPFFDVPVDNGDFDVNVEQNTVANLRGGAPGSLFVISTSTDTRVAVGGI